MNEELLQRLYFLGQQDGLDPQKTSYDDFKNLVITKPELVDRLYQLAIPDGLDTTRTSLDSFRSSLGVTAPQKKKEPSILENNLLALSQDMSSPSLEETSISQQDSLDSSVSTRFQGSDQTQPVETDLSSPEIQEPIIGQYFEKYGANYPERQEYLTTKDSLENELSKVKDIVFDNILNNKNIKFYDGDYYQYVNENGSLVRKDKVQGIEQARQAYRKRTNLDDIINDFNPLTDDLSIPDFLHNEDQGEVLNPLEVKRQISKLQSQIKEQEKKLEPTDFEAQKALINYHTDLEDYIRKNSNDKTQYDELSKKYNLNWGLVATPNIRIKTSGGEYKNATFLEARNYLIQNPSDDQGINFNQGLKDGYNDIIISPEFLKEEAGQDLLVLKETQKNYKGIWGEFYKKLKVGGLNLLGGEIDAAELPLFTVTGNLDEYFKEGGSLSNTLFEVAKEIQKKQYVYEHPGVINSLREGNIADAAAQLGGMVAENLPQILQMMSIQLAARKLPVPKQLTKRFPKLSRQTFGRYTSAGLLGAGAYGQTKNELEELSARNVENGISDVALFFNAGAAGFLELFFEHKTAKLLDGIVDSFKILSKDQIKQIGRKKAIEQITKNALVSFAKNSGYEGTAEALTESGQIATDIVTNFLSDDETKKIPTPENFRELSNQIGDSFLAGAAMVGTIQATGGSLNAMANGFNLINSLKVNESFRYTVTDNETGQKNVLDRNELNNFITNRDNIQKFIDKSISIDASMDPEIQQKLFDIETGLKSESGKKAKLKLDDINKKLYDELALLSSKNTKNDIQEQTIELLEKNVTNINNLINESNELVKDHPFLKAFTRVKKTTSGLKKYFKSKKVKTNSYTFSDGLNSFEANVNPEDGKITFKTKGGFGIRNKDSKFDVKEVKEKNLQDYVPNNDQYNYLLRLIEQSEQKVITKQEGQKTVISIDPSAEVRESDNLILPVSQSDSYSVGKKNIKGSINVLKLTKGQAKQLIQNYEQNQIFNSQENSDVRNADVNSVFNNKVLNNINNDGLDTVTDDDLQSDDGYFVLSVGGKGIGSQTESNQLFNLKRRLDQLKANYKKIVSVENGVRKESYLVRGIAKKEALQLTRDFNQNYTYSSKDGLLFSDGSSQKVQRRKGSNASKHRSLISFKDKNGERQDIGFRLGKQRSFGKEFDKSNVKELSSFMEEFPEPIRNIIGTVMNVINSVNGNIPFVIVRNSQALKNLLIQQNVELGEGISPDKVANEATAFYAPDGKVYINAGNMQLNTAFHEIVHPLVSALKQTSKGRAVYKKIEKTIKESIIQKRYFDETERQYKKSTYYNYAKSLYEDIGRRQKLEGKKLDSYIIEEAFAEMMADAAAQKFNSDKSIKGQVIQIIKEFLQSIFGSSFINKLSEKKSLDLLTLGDMSAAKIQSTFKRAINDGTLINIGDKEITFGNTSTESRLQKQLDKNRQGTDEQGEEVITEELNIEEGDTSERTISKSKIERKGFKTKNLKTIPIQSLNGVTVLVSPIDKSAAGMITSKTGVTHRMRGGILYPLLEGSRGWAFTTEAQANTVLNRLKKKKTNKIVFMSQANNGILSNANFIEYIEKEINNAILKNENDLTTPLSEKAILKRLNEITGEEDFKTVSDFFTNLKKVGTIERHDSMKKIVNEKLVKSLGFENVNEFLSSVSEPIIENAKSGDLVGVLSVDVDAPVIKTTEADEYHHPGYPYTIAGSDFFMFDKFANVVQAFPNFASNAEIQKARKENRSPRRLKDMDKRRVMSTLRYGAITEVETEDDFTGGDLQFSRFQISNYLRFRKAPAQKAKGFKEWFGKSKVVNEKGEPLKMLHGTREVFDAFFTKSSLRSKRTNDLLPRSTFFTSDADIANYFAGATNYDVESFSKLSDKEIEERRQAGEKLPQSNVIPVYIKAEKIWDYENSEHIDLILKSYSDFLKRQDSEITDKQLDKEITDLKQKLEVDNNWEEIEKFTHYIQESGFDSYYVRENIGDIQGSVKNIAVFDPENQVRSVFTDDYTTTVKNEEGIIKFQRTNDSKIIIDHDKAVNLYDSYFSLQEDYPYMDIQDGITTLYNFTNVESGITDPISEDLTEHSKEERLNWSRPRLYYNLNKDDNSNLNVDGFKNKALFPIDRLYPLNKDPLDLNKIADDNINTFKAQGVRSVATLNYDTDNINFLNRSIGKLKIVIRDMEMSDNVNIMPVEKTEEGLRFQINYPKNNADIKRVVNENSDNVTIVNVDAKDINYDKTEEIAKAAEDIGFQGFLYERDGELSADIWSPIQSNPETRFQLNNHKIKTQYVDENFGFLFDIKELVVNADYRFGKFLTGTGIWGSRINLSKTDDGDTSLEFKSSKYDAQRRYDIRASKLLLKPFGTHSRKDIKDIMLYSKSSVNYQLYQANENVKKLKQVIKDQMEQTKNTDEYKKLDAEGKRNLLESKFGHQRIQDLLTDKQLRKAEDNIELKRAINRLRYHMDSLSTTLIEEGLINDDLSVVVDANRGIYMHRNYKLYGKQSWSPTNETVERATLFMMGALKEQTQYQGMPENKLREAADKKIKSILRKDSGALNIFSKGFGNVITANTSIFKPRNENLPDEIKDLLGNINDPFNNYITTVGKVSQTIASDRMYEDLLKVGLGDFVSAPSVEDPNLPELSGDKFAGNKLVGRKWGPLENYFVDNEMFAVLTAFDEAALRAGEGTLLRGFLKLSLLGKRAKTVWSLGTHVRNVIGNSSFVFMNSHIGVDGKLGKGAVDTIKLVLGMGSPEMQALYKELVALGVVNTNAFLGEIRDISRQVYESDYDFENYFAERGNKTDLLTQTDNLLTKAYQAEDDVFKVFGYMQEKARYIDAGFSTAEAKRKAARNIRNTYPNYDEVPRFIRFLGRFPLVGTFVSFQAETVRCTKNCLQLSFDEMKSDNPKLKRLGTKRLASALTSLFITESIQLGLVMAGYGLSNVISKSLRGDDEEEFDETLKERSFFQPSKFMENIFAEWDRNGNNIISSKGTIIDYDKNSPFYKREVPYVDYINLSKMSGTGYVRDTYRVMKKGLQDPEGFESFARIVKQVYEPFLTIDMTTDVLREVVENKGNRIYRPSDTFSEQLMKSLVHIGKSIGPSTLNSAVKIAEAASNDDTNRVLSVEILALLGLRQSRLLPYTSARFDYKKVYTKMKDISNGTEKFIDVRARDPLKGRKVPKFSISDPFETAKRYKDVDDENYNKRFSQEYNNMLNITKGIIESGGRGEDIIEIITGKNVNAPRWLAMELIDVAYEELGY